MEYEETIRKYALQNAAKFGKAQPGAIIGKVLGEHKELISEKGEVIAKVNEILAIVNAMPLDEVMKELEKYEFVTKERREGLRELPGGEKGKVVMRFEPSPSGPLHIGHSYVLSLNYEYKKLYDGKLILRISDTNPTNIDVESYELLPDNAKWLTDDGIDECHVQSDRMELYYEYALRLIDDGKVYVCKCPAEEFRELAKNKTACPCRGLDDHAKRWRKMFSEYNEGDAVVRFKSDIAHPNPAMRDFPLLRISDEEHPRKKKEFRVWPLMNFSVAIDDLDMGVTHTLRAKDHADNAKRQEMIHHALGYATPQAISVGMINFEGFPVSCSKTRAAIEEGKYTGWEDIQIPFIPALRRRGFKAAALRKYAVEVGVTKNDKTVAIDEFFKTINAFNKDLIDSSAKRYSFVKDPMSVEISGAPEMGAVLDLHPDNDKGGRVFTVSGAVSLDIDDYMKIMESEGKLWRLAGLYNFEKKEEGLVYHSKDKDKCAQIIHWVSGEGVPVEVVMGDGNSVFGIGEKYLNDVKEGQIVQFERFGFVRCDKIADKMRFWWLHR